MGGEGDPNTESKLTSCVGGRWESWELTAGPEGVERRSKRGEGEGGADLAAGSWERVLTPPAGLFPLVLPMLGGAEEQNGGARGKRVERERIRLRTERVRGKRRGERRR